MNEFIPLEKGLLNWHEKYNADFRMVKNELGCKANLDESGRLSPMPTAEDIGAAAEMHSHDAEDISSGILPPEKGGTGVTKAKFSPEGMLISGQKAGTTVEMYATAEGKNTTASGYVSHAEGDGTAALDQYCHAEGQITTASALCSHSEGKGTTANGSFSHAEGYFCTAQERYSHAEGYETCAKESGSHAEGCQTIAGKYQLAIGKCNIESAGGNGSSGDVFIIGKGTADARANAFRVSSDGHVFGCYGYASTGADYAEYFEWEDGNPDNEDRRGLFVALDGERIRLAGPEDEEILGIVSANPAVIGDTYDDQWQGMVEKDVFGETLWEEKVIPAYADENGVEHEEECYMTEKLNPDYDSTQAYIPRSKRKEWALVGLLGKLVVIDDGSCEVNGYCQPSEGGIATKADQKTCFRVMKRLDENHIRVLVK